MKKYIKQESISIPIACASRVLIYLDAANAFSNV
jgi:hypothetical protein